MSPAISSVILTAATIVMVLVAMGYANNFLSNKMAENEYSTNKQFMLTTGLQIDDIAWTIGRTQTVRYASNYGSMKIQSAALTYNFEINGQNITGTTAIVMFNMPTSYYSLGNNYFERITPSTGSFLQFGVTAPICHVFGVEKVPMRDGSFIRVVAAPSVRVLNSSITTGGSTIEYVKFYLPLLAPSGPSPYNSQSVTLLGHNVTKYSFTGLNQMKIYVEPGSTGFDASFFRFDSSVITLNGTSIAFPKITSNTVVEIYFGSVFYTIGKV